MAEVFISFKAEGPEELMTLVMSYVLANKRPPSWLGQPLDGEALQAEAEARDAIDEADAKQDAELAKGNGEDLAPVSAPKPKRSSRKLAGLPEIKTKKFPLDDGGEIELAVVTEYKAPPPAPPVDLPPLDTLKATVTAAVRLAQKGEGPKTILDLLPGFKDTTGLAFVMNAEDKHRGALYDLVQAAGLPVV